MAKTNRLQNLTGIPVSRWIDGVLEDPDNMDKPDKVRAMVLWGHAPNSQTRLKEMKTAMEQLDMLVVVDPYPTVSAILHDRTDGVYLLPACTQFETRGSVTASNRSFQWREKVVDPLFESLPDHVIMAKCSPTNLVGRIVSSAISKWKILKRQMLKAVTREFNRGMWTIGYTGQSPERIKMHMANQHTFDQHNAASSWWPGRWRLLRSAMAMLGVLPK